MVIYQCQIIYTRYSIFRIKNVKLHCVNSVRIQSFSGPYFPTFGLNTEIKLKQLRILMKCHQRLLRRSYVLIISGWNRMLKSIVTIANRFLFESKFSSNKSYLGGIIRLITVERK